MRVIHSRVRLGTSALSLGLALAFAGSAVAQTAGQTGDSIQGGAQAAATGEVDSGDIVVTAQRESSLLSKTPVAMTAITGEGLREAGVTNPTQLTEAVPNLQITRGNGLQITIRGVTSTDSSEKGDPSVAFLQDGVYIARPQQQEVSFFDLERVEVLRGPQGTLYGRNTTAGVINLISASPQHEFGASVDASYASFNSINATGMINVPLGEAVAVRAAVNYDRRDSFVIASPASRFSADPAKDNLSGRLSALFEPSPDIRILARGDYSELRGRAGAGVPISYFFPAAQTATPLTDQTISYVDTGSSKDKRRTSYTDVWDPIRDNNTWGVMGQADWDLGPFALTYIGSHREATIHQRGTYNGGVAQAATPDALPTTTFDARYRQDSHELRLAFGKGGPLHGQVGGYYFHERSAIAFFLRNYPDILGPGSGAGLQFGFPQDPAIARSKAAFGQITFDVTPDLHLTGGVRYSEDKKSRVGQTVVQTLDGAPVALFQDNNAKRTYSKVTWRAGIDYDAPGLGLFYASVSTGYKAGGFNDGCQAGPGCTAGAVVGELYYDPETLTAYEGGVKLRLIDNALRLNIAAFHYDYAGLQLSSVGEFCGPGTTCQRTTNAARAKIDGVELEPVINLDANNRVNLSFTYLNARYAEFQPTPTTSFAGKKLDRSPEFTWAAGYTHSRPLANGGQLEAGAVIRFSDSLFFSDTSNRVQFIQPSFHKSDVTLTYRAPENRWYVQAFVRNIEDEVTVTSASQGEFAGAEFADPRLIGVRVGFKY